MISKKTKNALLIISIIVVLIAVALITYFIAFKSKSHTPTHTPSHTPTLSQNLALTLAQPPTTTTTKPNPFVSNKISIVVISHDFERNINEIPSISSGLLQFLGDIENNGVTTGSGKLLSYYLIDLNPVGGPDNISESITMDILQSKNDNTLINYISNKAPGFHNMSHNNFEFDVDYKNLLPKYIPDLPMVFIASTVKIADYIVTNMNPEVYGIIHLTDVTNFLTNKNGIYKLQIPSNMSYNDYINMAKKL